MSSLPIHVGRQLARTVRWTGRLSRAHTPWPGLSRVLAGIHFLARGVFHLWRNRGYYTLLKLANMALINTQLALKTQYVLGRPYRMKIESTNICNTHCQLCPTGLDLPGRAKGKMDPARFRGLIDKFKRYVVALDLSMWGDPLIVPEIYAMIRYAHDRGIWTYLSSNLHAFKPARGQAEALVNSGLDLLTCSLHGASQETYAQYQPGKNLEEALEKIRHIIATRDRMKSATPAVQLNFVVTRFNEHEQQAFADLAASLGCTAIFSPASMNTRFMEAKGGTAQLLNVGLAPDLQKKHVRKHLETWLPRDQRFVLEPYKRMLRGDFDPDEFNGRKIMDCTWPWRAAVINWDGSVVTCCGSWAASEDMGNVFTTPFAEIWNSPRYRLARRSFKRKLDPAQAKDNACAACPGYMV